MSRNFPKFQIRFPADLMDKVRAAATENGRSINGELVRRIRTHAGDATDLRLREDVVSSMIRIPPDVNEDVTRAARGVGRSKNAEIVARVHASFRIEAKEGQPVAPDLHERDADSDWTQFKLRLPREMQKRLRSEAKQLNQSVTKLVVTQLQAFLMRREPITISYIVPTASPARRARTPASTPGAHVSLQKLSYNMDELLGVTGMNRNQVYAAIAAGELKTFKVGKRRMTSHAAVLEFITRREAGQ